MNYSFGDQIPLAIRVGDSLIMDGETFKVMVHPQATRWERLILWVMPSRMLLHWPFKKIQRRLWWVGEIKDREVW